MRPLVHLHVLCETVPYPDGTFIIRRRLVRPVERSTVGLLKLLVLLLGCQSVEREVDLVNIVDVIRDDLHGRDRSKSLHTLRRAVCLIHTHHHPRDVVGGHRLAYQGGVIFAAIHQFGGVGCGQNNGFPMLLYVVLVDETPFQHLNLVHLHQRGITTIQINGGVATFEGQCIRTFEEFRGNLVHISGKQGALGDGHILVVENNAPTGLIAVGGFAGDAAIHRHRVGGKVAALVHEGVHQTVARAEKHDEHEDAPRHREPREGGAQLVTPDGLPYLCQQVVHNTIS